MNLEMAVLNYERLITSNQGQSNGNVITSNIIDEYDDGCLDRVDSLSFSTVIKT